MTIPPPAPAPTYAELRDLLLALASGLRQVQAVPNSDPPMADQTSRLPVTTHQRFWVVANQLQQAVNEAAEREE